MEISLGTMKHNESNTFFTVLYTSLKFVGTIFLCTIILLLGAEVALYVKGLMTFRPPESEWTVSGDIFEFSQNLGYKAKPSTKISAIEKRNNRVIYNVTFTTDSHGRRVTPEKNSPPKDRSIMFFGSSFTFGDGVQDNETMPYYVAQNVPYCRVYNYGFFSYGPQHMLAALENSHITDEVKEHPVMLVYTFIDASINIAIGSMNVYNDMGENMPFYTLDTDGKLRRNGTFSTGRPIISLMYKCLGKSNLLKSLHLDIPRIRSQHIALTARIIEESRNRFRDRFGSRDFYVIFYPGSQYSRKLIPYLKQADIKYFDYSELFNLKDPLFYIEGDMHSHPSPRAYEAIANKFIKDAGLSKANFK
jgi:hypothetical protein